MRNESRLKNLFLKAFKNTRQRESVIPDSLYCKIAYQFTDETLLQNALKHRSVTGEHGKRWESNERLEFLGDAVLGMIVTENLYNEFARASEGDLTRRKSYLVCRERLAEAARHLELGKFVTLSAGEQSSGGRRRDSILADTFEAVIGAIYLDGGYIAAEAFIRTKLLDMHKQELGGTFFNNYKSCLLEYAQGRGEGTPVYTVIAEQGPDHEKIFTIEVQIENKVLGKGSGNSKKKAEQEAAHRALDLLKLDIEL